MIDWRAIDEDTPRVPGKNILLCVRGWQPALGIWWVPPEGADWEDFKPRWLSIDPEGVFETDAALRSYLTGSRYEPTHWAPGIEGPESGDMPPAVLAAAEAYFVSVGLGRYFNWSGTFNYHDMWRALMVAAERDVAGA